MASNAVVRARVDEQVKEKATAVLAKMGLTVSDVVRMTLTRVANDSALPFELKVPNAETRAAMEETREMARQRRALGATLLTWDVRFLSNARDTRRARSPGHLTGKRGEIPEDLPGVGCRTICEGGGHCFQFL